MEEVIDFTEIAKKYKGKWVALSEDEKKVVASDEYAKEALEKAKKEGYKHPILFKVPVTVLPYVGGNSFIF